MIAMRCRLGWHRWSVWTAPDAYETMRRSVDWGVPIEGTERIVSGIRQERQCHDCGIAQVREVRT